MRLRYLFAFALLNVACRSEQSTPGRSAVRTAEDSTIIATLTTYYDRMSRRDWAAYRESFWPTGTISVRWQAPGEPRPTVHIQTIDQFVAQTKDGPDKLAVFEERMVHHEIRRYGDLAVVWATFRATFGMPGQTPATHYGVDCFQLLEDRGEWRIVSLAFTQELPGDPLPKAS